MWLVFQKEIKELLRDRRALFFMIALPLLLFPALFGIAGYFANKATTEAASKALIYGVVGGQYAPELVQKIDTKEGFEAFADFTESNFRQNIEQGDVDFVLVIPENYQQEETLNEQVKIELHLNNSSLNAVHSRVNEYV